MKLLRWFFLVVVSCGVLVGAELPSSFTPGSSPISPWVHRDSGFVFPAEVGGFSRGKAIQYDSSGRDVSVGYLHRSPLVVATFYVYPLEGRTLQEEFERRQNEVTTVSPKARLVSTGTRNVSPKTIPALMATYAIPEMFSPELGPMRSFLLVGKRDDRFIEYRLSFPVSGGEAGEKAANRFLDEFAWP